jgi:hypothetical protein
MFGRLNGYVIFLFPSTNLALSALVPVAEEAETSSARTALRLFSSASQDCKQDIVEGADAYVLTVLLLMPASMALKASLNPITCLWMLASSSSQL